MRRRHAMKRRMRRRGLLISSAFFEPPTVGGEDAGAGEVQYGQGLRKPLIALQSSSCNAQRQTGGGGGFVDEK